ncbi:DUF3592 domain-containing protein [uncultured Alistipes sp.]|uniref:DUF3592 domain-containing protein n=1 Tax=uncultured Alistipes sp. TaxID=538949 RepID=UPI0025D9236F|nr:DUF3592 domain-containing protein [uncultured Alistipes sp.]
MSRFLTTKRIILALVLLFAACGLYGYLVADRLKRVGVEARAVVTRVYSREETRTRRGTARRPRYEKVTVHYLDYRLTVDGRDYEDRIRRYDNLMTARVGDSLLVRYLPSNPDVNRPVRLEEGGYDLRRTHPTTYRRRHPSR